MSECVCVYIYIYIYTYISKLSLFRGTKISDTLRAINTPTAQILISKYHSPPKEPEILREMADS